MANTYCTQTKPFVKPVNSVLYSNCKALKTYRNPKKCLLKQEKLERGLCIELARAKSEALVNIFSLLKIKNRVMLLNKR